MKNNGCRLVVVAVVWSILAAIFAACAWLSAILFEYVLWCFFAKDVPWYADLIGGLIASGFLTPAAVGCWIARLMDVAVPFIQM